MSNQEDKIGLLKKRIKYLENKIKELYTLSNKRLLIQQSPIVFNKRMRLIISEIDDYNE